MTEALNYIFEMVVIHAIFLVFYKMVIERENHFRFNRFYLLTSSLLSVIIPILSFHIGVNTPVISRVMGLKTITLDTLTVGAMNTGSGTETGKLLISALMLIYIAGLLILVWKLGWTLVEFYRMIRTTKGSREAKYIIYDTRGEFPSFSFLHYIFINRLEDMDNDDYRRILLHEKVHADQWHTLDLMFIELLRIVFWFNPFIWIYRKLIVETDEYLADEGVLLESGFEDYASLIVNQVFHTSRFQFANHFHSYKTLKRIKNMKNIKKPNLLKLALALPLLAILILIFSFDNAGSTVVTDDPSSTKVKEIVTNPVKNITENENQLTMAQDDSVFTVVENVPEPIGGIDKFFESITATLKYPQDAKEKGIEGKVFIQFVVMSDGSINDVKVIRGLSESCDAEAIRVIRENPTKWKPGEHEGKKVNVRFVLPIMFKLS